MNKETTSKLTSLKPGGSVRLRRSSTNSFELSKANPFLVRGFSNFARCLDNSQVAVPIFEITGRRGSAVDALGGLIGLPSSSGRLAILWPDHRTGLAWLMMGRSIRKSFCQNISLFL